MKSLSRAFIIALLASVSFRPTLFAQEANHCEWLMRYGIYDTTEYRLDQHKIGHFASLIESDTSQTLDQFKQSGKSLGIDVPLLASLSFGGHDAEKEFLQWKAALRNAANSDSSEHQQVEMVVRKISPELMKTVQACIERTPPGMLRGWLKPSPDDRTFIVNLKYTPPVDNLNATISSISFVSSTRGVIQPLNDQEAALVKPGAQIPIAGVAVTMQRKEATESITININTSVGAITIAIPGYDQKAAIDRLSRSIDELQKEIATLKTQAERQNNRLTKSIEAIQGVDGLEFLTINTGIIDIARQNQLPPVQQRGHISLVPNRETNNFDLSHFIPAGYEAVAAFPISWDYDTYAREFEIISVGLENPKKLTLTVRQGQKGGALVGFATCILVRKQ